MRWMFGFVLLWVGFTANAQEFFSLDSVELIKKHKLKALVVTVEDLHNDESAADTVFFQYFDQKGQTIEQAIFDADFEEWNAYRYDAEGNQVGRYEMSGPLDTMFIHESTFEQGRLTQIRSFPVSRNLMKTETYEYNDQGNLTKHQIWNTDGKMYFQQSFTYNRRQLPTQIVTENLNDPSSKILKTYSYNANDREQLITTSSGKRYTELRSTYDDTGQLISKNYFVNGQPVQSERRVYEGGKLIQVELTDADAKEPIETKRYAYNAQGHKTRYERSTTLEQISFSYLYNTEGNVVKETFIRTSEGRTLQQIKTFDDNGRVLSDQQTANGKPEWHIEYGYRADGLCVSKLETNQVANSAIRYTYHYTQY